MPNLNSVQLMGNLTRDPELKYTPKGTAIVALGLAVNRVWSNEAGEKQEEVTFIDIEMWGRKGEVVAEHHKKGDPIFLAGRLKLDSWDDKTSGQKRYKLKVIAEDFEFIKARRETNNPEADATATPRRPASSAPARPPARPPADPDLDGGAGDDIPF